MTVLRANSGVVLNDSERHAREEAYLHAVWTGTFVSDEEQIDNDWIVQEEQMRHDPQWDRWAA
jgi:hypothetical protein